MESSGRTIRIVKKGNDDENLRYYLSLSYQDRLEHLERLRTEYIKWQNTDDPKPRLQRVYTVTKQA